jgi:hypothetical protein
MRSIAGHSLSIALFGVLALGTALSGAVGARPADGPPDPKACPTVENVDLKRIARAQRTPSAPDPNDRLRVVQVPASASRRPPADAPFIVRVRLPPGGGYARDERAVVWREADGSWWGWRQVLGGEVASAPPPPMPGSPEEAEKERDYAAGRPWYFDPYPPYEGRLNDEQAAMMEAAWADPCRQLEPDFWPWKIPLLRRVDGRRVHKCQLSQHATFYTAEFTEPGRPPRRIGLKCGSAGTVNAVLVTHAAHVQLPRTEPRRQTDAERKAIEESRLE